MSAIVDYRKSVPGGVSRRLHVLVENLGNNHPHTVKGQLCPCVKVTRPVRLCNAVIGLRCGVGMSLILHFA